LESIINELSLRPEPLMVSLMGHLFRRPNHHKRAPLVELASIAVVGTYVLSVSIPNRLDHT
jgi:hypothetical protein